MEKELVSHRLQVKAFEDASRKMYGQLFRIARTYIHEDEEAKDAVQETLMRCWLLRHRFKNTDNLSAVATTIIKNLCVDYLRQNKSLITIDNSFEQHDITTPDHLLIEKEQQEWMMTCLKRLPIGARAAIQMKGIDGLSYQEMANILGTTEATVRAKVAKARQQLWQLYKRRK